MKRNIQFLQSRIESMLRRYDAENDLIPGQPVVTSSDYLALIALLEIIQEIETLNNDIVEINQNLYYKELDN